MTIQEALSHCFGKYSELEQVQSNVFRLYAPFFHEDGDMYSIYIETSDDGIIVRDFGNTLMRVSYTFDLSSKNKQSILQRIVSSNMGELDDGEILMRATMDRAQEAIFQYAQLVAKVSNIDILSRETMRSMFYEYLNDFVMTQLRAYRVRKQSCPTSDRQLVVDYEIPGKKPIYLFGVNDNTKASKVVISCLNFQKANLPFRSVIVHEDFNALTAFNRSQITNAVDKQFSTLSDFQTDGVKYLEREISVA